MKFTTLPKIVAIPSEPGRVASGGQAKIGDGQLATWRGVTIGEGDARSAI
jgi:hypothetical protein